MRGESLDEGSVEEAIHSNRARLLDYINNPNAAFFKLHIRGNTTLANKSYIIHGHLDSLEGRDA